MAQLKYELLKERALNSIELLFAHWKIDYVKIGNEYDFLSPSRKDENFGACKFNASKGIGSDFAGTNFDKSLFESIGQGFSKEDFAGFTKYGETKSSFDIIGIAQRVYGADNYSDGAARLKEDLDLIDGGKVDVKFLLEQSSIRHEKTRLQKEKMQSIAAKSWKYCSNIKGTIGEKYLNSRNIELPDWFDEPNMKFHPKVFNTELKLYIPALVFKVSNSIDGDLKAIHRVWIAKDGSRKAKLEEGKKAIGTVEGNAIWFGKPSEILYICEGPEEALTVKFVYGKEFVISTVYSTNFHLINIPEHVKKIVLVPDEDDAGKKATLKAIDKYKNQGKEVKIIYRGTTNG